MKAIILAGGFGTRLKSVLTDTPKPMAPINGKPFLAYLIEYLAQSGITEVVLSVHYLGEQIQHYFQDNYQGVTIRYTFEESPLGTGGAIAYALKQLTSMSDPVFVLNGDTFVKINYQAMYAQHRMNHSVVTMALRLMEDCQRYGKVIDEKGIIIDFREKDEAGPGWINAGIYLLQPDIFSRFQMPLAFSFENDFMQPHLKILQPQSFAANDYFIDIGIPEDYARAMQELPKCIAEQPNDWPKLSIIMPVYNREDTIEKAILSVIKQDYPNMELIILDGGSTDKTVDIIKKYQANITYWHSRKDNGAADASNFGIQIATGDAIGLLMADDWYEPGIFKIVGEVLVTQPSIEIISFFGRLVEQGDDNTYLVKESSDNPADFELNFYNICYRVTGICFRFIRRITYLQLGHFLTSGPDEKQLLTNDKEYLFRAVLADTSSTLIPQLGYTHFAHRESFSFSKNYSVVKRHCREHIWIADDYLQNKKLSFTQRWFVRMWRNDQAAELVIFHLLDKEVASAVKVFKSAWAKDLLWPMFCLATSIWVAGKRFIRLIKRCCSLH